MVFDKPIILQVINQDTETWTDAYKLHARVNSSKQSETSGSADRVNRELFFTIRYSKVFANIANNTQLYRIVFEGVPYDIQGYDDYMMKHQTIKLRAVSLYV